MNHRDRKVSRFRAELFRIRKSWLGWMRGRMGAGRQTVKGHPWASAGGEVKGTGIPPVWGAEPGESKFAGRIALEVPV